MTCPRCGVEAVGNFCASCGTSMKPEPCGSCGAQPEVGDRFCNTCGTFLEGRTSAGSTGRGGTGDQEAKRSPAQLATAGWWVAGAMLVVVILMASRSVFDRTGAERGASGPVAGADVGQVRGQNAAAVDLTSMTPREAADRLFNRVMRGVSAGDSPEVEGFLPMAVAAYERARPLDADGTFHLALLHLTALDFERALASVDEALTANPDHLLLLSAAAEASVQAGDREAAAVYYARIMEKWDDQVALELDEYQVHATMLPEIEEDAREFLEGTP